MNRSILLALSAVALVLMAQATVKADDSLPAGNAETADEPDNGPVSEEGPTPTEDDPAATGDETEEPDEVPEDTGAESPEVLPSDPAATTVDPSPLDRFEAMRMAEDDRLRPPMQRYPYVEWHGYYRVRSGLYGEVDLGTYTPVSETDFTATSMFLPPLSRNFANSSGGASFSDQVSDNWEKTIGTANMRLRLDPTIHISDTIRIGVRVDVLDNIVLGSTPEYVAGLTRPGVPLDTMTQTQIPPVSGLNSFSDSFSVQEAWVEWTITLAPTARADENTRGLGTLKLGRFSRNWGLGIWSSSGNLDRRDLSLRTSDRLRYLDMDGANILDRVQWSFPLSMLRIEAGFAMLATGPTSQTVATLSPSFQDLGDDDDIYQFELAVTNSPSGAEQWDDYRKTFLTGRPTWTWGASVVWRNQSMASVHTSSLGSATASGSANFADYELVDRNAWMLVPDAFIRLDWRPDSETSYFVAAEAVAVYGNIGNPTAAAGAQSVDVFQWGAAVESSMRYGPYSFGVDLGAASGDSPEMLAVAKGSATPWGSDNSWSSYRFNTNYHIDMLLFREVLGGVSNAAYVRPHFEFDLIPTPESAFGTSVSAVYGLALNPDAYPGDDPSLGLELDASIFYEEVNSFAATLGFGALMPLWALDRPENYLVTTAPAKDSVWAWTFQGNIYFVF